MKKQIKKITCDCCGDEAEYFHSRCCGVHFEGVIHDGEPMIVCEECGEFVGLVYVPEFEKKSNRKVAKKKKV